MALQDVLHIADPTKNRREGSVTLNIPGTGSQFLNVYPDIVEKPLATISGRLEDQFDMSDQHVLIDNTGVPVVITQVPLPVDLVSIIDTGNSTSVPLGGNESWTGAACDVIDYGFIFVNVYSDVAAMNNGLSAQQSMDGINWDNTDTYTVPAGIGKTYAFQPGSQWFRVVYTNNGVAQSEFRLQTVLKKGSSLASSHRIYDAIVDEDDARLVKAVLTGKKTNGIFDNVSLTNGANMKVSLEEIESSISSNGNTQLNVTPFDSAGNEGCYLIDGQSGNRRARLDTSTYALNIIDYAHHEIHDGSHYTFSTGIFDLDNTNTAEFILTTPDTTKLAHLVYDFSSTLTCRINAYEDTTHTTGVLIDSYNNNRNSANVAGVKLSTSNNDGVDGNQIWNTLLGMSAGGGANLVMAGGASRGDHEWILKQNTKYLLRITSLADNNNVDCSLSWYEHTDKS